MYRRYLAWYVAFNVIFGVTCPAALTYLIDPLQFFRRASYAPTFSTNERHQLPGLIRNYDYDTAIVGTSMAQNFYPSYADRVLHAHTIKLAISGSTVHEQFLVARLALLTGKPRRVIWGVDDWVFRGAVDRVRSDLGAFPYYLYDGNPVEHVWYLLNVTNISEAFAIISDRGRFFLRSVA